MSVTIPNPARTSTNVWLARATAALTAFSLQIVWLGAFLCTVECAKGACHGAVVAGTGSPAGRCGHPTSDPHRGSNGSHSPNCPASYLRHWSGSRNAVAASQAWVAAPVILGVAATCVGGTSPVRPADAAPHPELSPPLLSAERTPLPLRL